MQIILRLRDDVLRDRDGHNAYVVADSLYPGGPGFSMPSLLPSVPPVASLGYDQRNETGSGLGLLSSSSLHGYGSLPVRHSFATFFRCSDHFYQCLSFLFS